MDIMKEFEILLDQLEKLLIRVENENTKDISNKIYQEMINHINELIQ